MEFFSVQFLFSRYYHSLICKTKTISRNSRFKESHQSSCYKLHTICKCSHLQLIWFPSCKFLEVQCYLVVSVVRFEPLRSAIRLNSVFSNCVSRCSFNRKIIERGTSQQISTKACNGSEEEDHHATIFWEVQCGACIYTYGFYSTAIERRFAFFCS